MALVVAAHFGYDHIVPGGLGVTTFFFISGFIITRLLLAEIDRTGGIDLVAFYRRRFWRLWPAVVGAVLGMVLLGALFGELWSPVSHVISCLLFAENYWGILDPAQHPLGIHWSLAVEFHFYLVWPFLLLAFLSRPGLAVPATIAALAIILAFRTWVVLAFQQNGLSWEAIKPWTYSLSHMRADSLIFGCLLAMLAYDRSWRKLLDALAHQRSIWIGLGLLLVTLVLRDDFFRMTVRYSVQGVALLLIFSGVLFADRAGLFRWFLNMPAMIWIGAISFSIYLWHKTVWRVVDYAPGMEGGAAHKVLAVALTLLAAWLSYRFIEQRFMKFGRKSWTARSVNAG